MAPADVRRLLVTVIGCGLLLSSALLFVPAPAAPGLAAASISTPPLSALAGGARLSVPLASTPPPSSGSAAPYHGNVSVFVTLDLQNQSRLGALLTALSDPSSPEYHQYLSASEFAQEFSPPASTYGLAVAYFQEAAGVRVISYSDRIGVLLEGAAPAIGALFEVAFAQSVSPSAGAYYVPVGIPTLPAFLDQQISSVDGLSGYGSAHTATTAAIPIGPASSAEVRAAGYPTPTPCGSDGEQCFWGSDLQVAYDEQSLLSITEPTQEVVATILWAGQNDQGQAVGPYVPADIYDYYNSSLPAGEPHSTVYPVPFDGGPLPGISASNDTTGAVGENTLDLEMVGSTAPGASIYNVYGTSAGGAETDGAFAFILSPSGYPGLHNVSVISNSWGSLDENDSAWVPLLQEAQARGITVLAATGDSGDDPSSNSSVGSQVEFPSVMAYNTFGVTAVGGTALTVNADPGSPQFLSITSQSAWFQPDSATGPTGSTGGVSEFFAEPSWQRNSGASAVIAATGMSGRGVPDVAAIAQDMFVIATSYGNQLTYRDFGTSVATPVVAGLIAEANAVLARYHQPNLGYLNPQAYSWANQMIQAPAAGSQSGSIVYGSYNSSLPMLPFYDVQEGSNYLYPAVRGYDLVTGWGSIDTYNFTAFALSFDYAGSTFALDGVRDSIDLSGLAVTSAYRNSSARPEYNASIQQNVFLANSLGAPIYWIQDSVDLRGSPASGWQVTVMSWVYYPFYGRYPDDTVGRYQISSAPTATIPANWTLTTSLERSAGAAPQIVFEVGGLSLNTSVPGAEFIIGGSGYEYYWQGTEYTNGPYPNTTAPGGLAPQLGLLGSPSGTTGVFSAPTSGTVTPTYLPTGSSVYVAPDGAGLVNTSIAQSAESAEHLAWTAEGASWAVSVRSASVDQGFFIYSTAAAGNPVDFQLTVYAVAFNETGLGSGTLWSVTLGGITENSSSAVIIFEMLNGTYAFSVPSVSGSDPSPGSGSVAVEGGPSNVSLIFAAGCTGFSCDLASIPGGWVIYAVLGVVAIAVIALIALVAGRRPGRPPSGPDSNGPPGGIEPMVPPYNPR